MKKRTMIIGAVVIFLLGALVFGSGAVWSVMMGGGSSYSIDYDWGMTDGIAVNEYAPALSGSANVKSEDYDYNYEEADAGFTDFSVYGETDQKWIVTVNMSVETKEYDTFMSMLDERMKQYGAYAENSDERDKGGYYQSRVSQLTIRVPVEYLDAFLTDLDNGSSVLSKSRKMENITLRYSDVETYKKSLELEQEQLMKLLTKAETVDEIIRVRDRLSSLQYQIEQQGTTLRTYDDKVAFATISLSVTEVVELSRQPMNFFERAGQGIVENLNQLREQILALLLYLITHIPMMLFWGMIAFVLGFIIKLFQNRRKARALRREKKNNETVTDVKGTANTEKKEES